jgi:colanic acid biosynthesis glycosyl transferase WcaI
LNYAPELIGVGKFTGEIGRHFSDQGVDVIVVAAQPHYPEWQVLAPARNRYSVMQGRDGRIFRCPLFLRRPMRGVWRILAPATFTVTSLPVLVWAIIRYRPSTILCVEPTLFAAPAALALASLFKSRAVLHVQDLEVDAAFAVGHIGANRQIKSLAKAIESILLRKYDVVVTISRNMQEKLAEMGVPRERLELVRNWVDFEQIKPANKPSCYRNELGFSPFDYVVQYSGSIGRKQALHTLLEAARLLSDKTGIRFLIAGEGPEKDGLVRNYGALPNVTFLGLQPPNRMNEFLACADLHVIPQLAGAADLVLPSKLGGMLASGRPVLVQAAPCTELSTFLGKAVAYCEPGSADDMASAILRCHANRYNDSRMDWRLQLASQLSKRVAMDQFTRICELERPPVAVGANARAFQ